jgi:hypothetical protein
VNPLDLTTSTANLLVKDQFVPIPGSLTGDPLARQILYVKLNTQNALLTGLVLLVRNPCFLDPDFLNLNFQFFHYRGYLIAGVSQFFHINFHLRNLSTWWLGGIADFNSCPQF